MPGLRANSSLRMERLPADVASARRGRLLVRTKAEMAPAVYVGCAGWSIPKEHAGRFPAGGSHLERYAGRFNAVEINSSFYRPHRPETYARWAASVPESFQFAVKIPKEMTHTRRLRDVADPLARFLSE